MKLYAPSYYKKFKCIADKCTHSCCVGWEIDIDNDTLQKYKSLTGNYAAAIAESISEEDTPHFKLGECDRCPHLDGRGLCKIITNVGEDYLCDVCREHPRFYNYTDVCEVGLGMSCPEAARIILSSPDYTELEEIGNVDAEADVIDFDGRAERKKIYEILKSPDGYTARLNCIYNEYAIDAGDDVEWLKILDSLEYLSTDHKALFMNYSSARRPVGEDGHLERFLAYLIYRHCTEAFDYDDFCARLSFCLFCERLLASLICLDASDTVTLASIVSEELEYSEDNTLALMYQ